MGKEKFLETKALKVYSRTRARRNPNSVVKLERKKILKTRTRALMGINFYYLDLTHHPTLHHQIQRRNFFQTVLQRKPRM